MIKLGRTGRLAVTLAGALATGAGTAAAEGNYGFIDGFAVNHDERMGDGDLSYGARIGAGIPLVAGDSARSALELGLFANEIDTSRAGKGGQIGAMLDLVHTFELGQVDPFVFGGVGAVREDAGRAEGTYPAIEAGLGASFGLADGRALRASFAAQEVFNDEVNPARDAYVDYRFTVGFRMPFGETAPPPAAPPADRDGDGVPDTQDLCPAQPAPTADGCPAPLAPAAPPRDTDGDGVDDSKDECPGTLGGLSVDASGCVTATSQKVVLKGVNFLPNSAELTADAKTVLDEAHAALAGQGGLRVEVGGHTDTSGADAANLALSQRRADSVRKYLVDKGIDAGRLVAKGYGESQPVADNKTKAGRTENRRVELKILD